MNAAGHGLTGRCGVHGLHGGADDGSGAGLGLRLRLRVGVGVGVGGGGALGGLRGWQGL